MMIMPPLLLLLLSRPVMIDAKGNGTTDVYATNDGYKRATMPHRVLEAARMFGW